MAKKKVSRSHHEKPMPKQEDSVQPHKKVTAAMDSEATEKIESLKSLNQMLLKEAVERRQQVDSLIQSKEYLELELNRSNLEMEALRYELTQLGDGAVRLEIQRSVAAVFVAVEIGLKGEMVGLKMKDFEVEMSGLKRVIDEKESDIELFNRKVRELEVALGKEREVMKGVCTERDELNEKLEMQTEECKRSRANLFVLEERKGEMEQQIGELRAAYAGVVAEKEERNLRIESIMREKTSIEMSLVESDKLIEGMKKDRFRIVKEKEAIENEKNEALVKSQELENALGGLNEIVVNLQREDGKLRAVVAGLENKCIEGEERQKDMVKEIDELVKERKLSHGRIEALVGEKAVAEKDLGKTLEQLEAEKRKIEEMVGQESVLMEANGKLKSEVDVLENHVVELKSIISKLEESGRADEEKIQSLENAIEKYSCKLEQLKVERDEIKSCLDEEKKNAVRSMETIDVLENKIKDSLKAVEGAEAENAAVRSEKVEVESQREMLKKEISSLENMIVEAQRKKSFWTVLSSATTLLAAVSVAYIARGH